MPKSVLRYSLDKGQYFGLEISLHPLLFTNKKTGTHHIVKLFIELGLVLVKKDLMFLLTLQQNTFQKSCH